MEKKETTFVTTSPLSSKPPQQQDTTLDKSGHSNPSQGAEDIATYCMCSFLSYISFLCCLDCITEAMRQ